jgi:hypothetical protein
MLTVLTVGILASSAWATAYTQIYVCSNYRQNLWDREWCEKDWDDTATWSQSGYPDDTGDTATIGGNNDASNRGEWQRINMSTQTIGDLKIWIPGASGTLYFEFWGSGTITTTKLTIDASAGNISVIAGRGAAVQTN